MNPINKETPTHWMDLILEELKHSFFPSQAPLDYFVHHNTLHALEHLPFPEALRQSEQQFSFATLMAEETYLNLFRTERITEKDLDSIFGLDSTTSKPEQASLSFYLQHPVSLKKQMLLQGLFLLPSSVSWVLHEQDQLFQFPSLWEEKQKQKVLTHFQKELLENTTNSTDKTFIQKLADRWDAGTVLSQDFMPSLKACWKNNFPDFSLSDLEPLYLHCLWFLANQWIEQTDFIGKNTLQREYSHHFEWAQNEHGEGLHRDLFSMMVRFLSGYLDQGVSYWEMPNKDHSLVSSFLSFFRHHTFFHPQWLRRSVLLLEQNDSWQTNHGEWIAKQLTKVQVSKKESSLYLQKLLEPFRGWLGMFEKLEHSEEKTLAKHSTDELIALLVTLQVQRIFCFMEEKSIQLQPWEKWKLKKNREPLQDKRQKAYSLFQCWVQNGFSVQELFVAEPSKRIAFLELFFGVSEWERCWFWQLAYEKQYRDKVLQVLVEKQKKPSSSPNESPLYQAFFCIDDREESFRRHLEEVDPLCETFGVAGFFGLDMRYKSSLKPNFRSVCPPNMTPKHYVFEYVDPQQTENHKDWSKVVQKRRWLAKIRMHGFVGSRSLLRGLFYNSLVGVLGLIPLFARIFFPRKAKQWEKRVFDFLSPAVKNKVLFLRDESSLQEIQHTQVYQNFPLNEDESWGFTQEELVQKVAGILQTTGLTKDFAPLVFWIGHGTYCVNNPHEAAYNCGACAGTQGGVNGRVFAQVANLPNIRKDLLEQYNLVIPESTYFVGGFHDTASDEVIFYDTEQIPSQHQNLFQDFQATLKKARENNSHERCRKLMSASLGWSASECLTHVENRVQDLTEPRPECGHATNALCIVGRRTFTENVFLDRRAFLCSYDPTQDPQGDLLGNLLGSVVFVCAGINLEYFFSFVDNQRWGSGTKLPHNVVGYFGVMDGHASDLRTGLPLQMVEIHEPMRLLFVVESEPHLIENQMKKYPAVQNLIENEWVQFSVFSLTQKKMFYWQNGAWQEWKQGDVESPQAESSLAYYTGSRLNLPPALLLRKDAQL